MKGKTKKAGKPPWTNPGHGCSYLRLCFWLCFGFLRLRAAIEAKQVWLTACEFNACSIQGLLSEQTHQITSAHPGLGWRCLLLRLWQCLRLCFWLLRLQAGMEQWLRRIRTHKPCTSQSGQELSKFTMAMYSSTRIVPLTPAICWKAKQRKLENHLE